MSLETKRAARLDKALCCDEWRRMFPSTSVHHLIHSHLDRYPVLLDLNGTLPRRLGDRMLKFQAVWLLCKDFTRWMESLDSGREFDGFTEEVL